MAPARAALTRHDVCALTSYSSRGTAHLVRGDDFAGVVSAETLKRDVDAGDDFSGAGVVHADRDVDAGDDFSGVEA